MRKKILLLAYTNINFGDDMFVKTICDYYPSEKFVLEAPEEYKNIFVDTPNLKIVSNSIYKRIIIKLCKIQERTIFKNLPSLHTTYLNKYKAIVYVIGGLFDEDDIWYTNVERFGLKVIKNEMWKYSLCESVPFFLLGCNITRVKTDKYIKQMEYLFEGLKDVCFRDKYSFNKFSSLKNVRYAPDIVFNYKCCETSKNSDTILISVWGALTQCDKFLQWKWAENYYNEYEQFIINVVKAFLERKQKVCLLALCEDEGDTEACHRIISKGNFTEHVTLEVYNGNLNNIISLFEKAKFVIGTRFHSIIMALNSGTAFYPVVYESKTLQLIKDIDYKDSYSNIEDFNTYNVDNVMNLYEKGEAIDCEIIKSQSRQQFKKLSEYLK
jgi:colanic acid/amylovoran biosynthesis protein